MVRIEFESSNHVQIPGSLTESYDFMLGAAWLPFSLSDERRVWILSKYAGLTAKQLNTALPTFVRRRSRLKTAKFLAERIM
jgi:hypothetical protein